MGIFTRKGSSYFWMLLEGHGRRRESTGIKCNAHSPKVRAANREQAQAIYHARMTQLARQKVGLPVDSAKTFKAFSEWFETHHTAKHRGADRERVILAHLRDHFGTMRLTEISANRWKEYETQRTKAGISINTVGRELAVMKSILNAAVGDHVEVSPLAHVKRKSVRLPPKRTITAAEEARLLQQLKGGKTRGGTFGDEELHDLYIVGLGTLLRQSNLIELKRSQYQGSRIVAMTKTGPHQISLTGPSMLQVRAARVLKKRLPKEPDGLFFPKWAGKFAKERNGANAMFLSVFRRACKRAGIPWGLKNHGVTWHSATRGSGATRMLRDFKIDVRTVQYIGNWKSLDQMSEYLGIELTFSGVQTVHSENPKPQNVRAKSA